MISIKNKVRLLSTVHSQQLSCVIQLKAEGKKKSCLLQLLEKSLNTPNPMPLSIKVIQL